MFPGQGAQRVGMGRELFDRFPELESQASDVLGYSLRRLCLEDPEGLLGNTRYTQPAMFAVNALALRAHLEDTGERPDLAVGTASASTTPSRPPARSASPTGCGWSPPVPRRWRSRAAAA